MTACLLLALLTQVTAVTAADRTIAFFPLPPDAGELDQPAEPDKAAWKSSITPDQATGFDDHSAWSRYIELWRFHHDHRNDPSVRRLFSLPADRDVLISNRPGRRPPSFLSWRPGQFRVIQTSHFEILSQAPEEMSLAVAREIEKLYWIWTQNYFPLWSGGDQVELILEDWNPESSSAAKHLGQRNGNSRLSIPRRHQVVLLADADSYQRTVASPAVAAGNAAAVVVSTGFYSSDLRASFFAADGDAASLKHEICHQLFLEATDSRLGRKTVGNAGEFWLIEGIAGHFESVQFHDRVATLGGWDSPRLQFARYQTLIANRPIISVDELTGTRQQIQARDDLSTWYGQAILRTHVMNEHRNREGDSPNTFPYRARLLGELARAYEVKLSLEDAKILLADVPSSRSQSKSSPNSNELNPAEFVRFLKVTDDLLRTHPISGQTTALCLAGCDITAEGLEHIPPLKNVTWLDLSRLPVNDNLVSRLIAEPTRLEQLSLEDTQITPAIGALIGRLSELREIDLSWTKVDDATIEQLSHCKKLEVAWLTGASISDQTITSLARCPNLNTLDVQQTQVTPSGLDTLRKRLPGIQLNPLTIRSGQ